MMTIDGDDDDDGKKRIGDMLTMRKRLNMFTSCSSLQHYRKDTRG